MARTAGGRLERKDCLETTLGISFNKLLIIARESGMRAEASAFERPHMYGVVLALASDHIMYNRALYHNSNFLIV